MSKFPRCPQVTLPKSLRARQFAVRFTQVYGGGRDVSSSTYVKVHGWGDHWKLELVDRHGWPWCTCWTEYSDWRVDLTSALREIEEGVRDTPEMVSAGVARDGRWAVYNYARMQEIVSGYPTEEAAIAAAEKLAWGDNPCGEPEEESA
jgi:hypothetical protein